MQSSTILQTNGKVLIVDDDRTTRLLTRSALEPAGFEVLDAANGEEALALFDAYTPDLVLLDLLMPEMDGYQVCRKLRSNPANADIPLLMMTGLNDLETISRAYQAGATDFITKPVRWPVLPHRVAYLIQSSRTHRALKESEERHKNFFEHNKSVILVVDPADGSIADANPAACSFYGWTRDEMQQKTIADLSTLSMEQLVIEMQKAVSGECNHCFFDHRLADSTIRQVEIFCSPVISCRKPLIVAIVHDISERRLAEEALRESETRFRSIMDLTPTIAVQGYNLNGTTTYWNHFSEQLYGYLQEEAVGTNLLDLIIPPEMREDVKGAMTWMAENGQPIPSSELQLMRKDGSRVPVFSSHALLHPPGKEPELFCMDLDLSALKQTEAELREAKDAAEAASAAKTSFLATMSHEIRTPLSALLGNIELLEQTAMLPLQQQYLQDCSSAARMLLQVINDVLDFSKIEAGKFELANEPFSLTEMGRQLVRIFAITAEKKGLDLTLSLADDLPGRFCGDQHRLRQIISNLLSNAIKFTLQGQISLQLSRLEASPETSERLLITVSDTGIGIPREKQGLIFESFTQVENFNKRRHSGTGLGLSICRRLAEMMGGEISLQSVPDQGSTFTLSLPVTTCPEPEQKPVTDTDTDTFSFSRKILLADDDQLGRSVITSMLQRSGHAVTAVESGVELLEMLQREAFDIVLTDISMPDLDGIGVARIIRSGERPGINPKIPMIAITAHAFSTDREYFLKIGIDGYVAKPVDFSILLAKIESLCCLGR